jgi:hypothetical protein
LKPRSALSNAADRIHLTWVRLKAWNEAQKKVKQDGFYALRGVAFCVLIASAMAVAFGTGTRLRHRSVGGYGTIQLQSRFDWNLNNRILRDGYAIFPYEHRQTGPYMSIVDPPFFEGMAIGAWSEPRREEVWSELKAVAAARVGPLDWRKERDCLVGSGPGSANMKKQPAAAVVCEAPDRRVAVVWYGPREYGSPAEQMSLVTTAMESFDSSR